MVFLNNQNFFIKINILRTYSLCKTLKNDAIGKRLGGGAVGRQTTVMLLLGTARLGLRKGQEPSADLRLSWLTAFISCDFLAAVYAL